MPETPDNKHAEPHGVPRWVKGLAIGGVAVLLALLIVALVVGGDHGPGRHSLGDTSIAESVIY